MSSSPGPGSPQQEEGDYIINWHLSFASNVTLQGNTSVSALADTIKAELAKIRADFESVKKLPGSHKNLMRLKATDADLRNLLDTLKETADTLRAVAARSAQRII